MSSPLLVDAVTVAVLAGALFAATVGYALALPWRRAEVEALDGAAVAAARAGIAELGRAAVAGKRWLARPAASVAPVPVRAPARSRGLAEILG
jgi:hypothetical protein